MEMIGEEVTRGHMKWRCIVKRTEKRNGSDKSSTAVTRLARE